MGDFSFDAIVAIFFKVIYIIMISADWQIVDLTHDTRHVYTHARTDGIKAMLRGFAGGKKVSKPTDKRIRSWVCLC